MPEFFDPAEALRLHEDASALVAEVSAGSSDDPETLTKRVLAEEVLAEHAESLDALLRRAIAEKQWFYTSVASLFKMMGQGAEKQDMALVRGGHAGLRALAMKELARGAGGDSLPAEADSNP